jgi:hypothetical protein
MAASLAICAFRRKVGLQIPAMRLSLPNMKKNILLLAAASTLFLSPSLALGAPASPDSASVASIRDKAHQSDSFAYDSVEGLTTEIGPRQGGTEAEARADLGGQQAESTRI